MKPLGNQKKMTFTQFTMRIDDNIYELVKCSAKENRRSNVAEINHALEQYYRDKK